MYQQLSPGQREEMSLLVAYPPLPSPPLAASTPAAHSRRRRLCPEEPACSLQAAALGPLLLRNQPAETPLSWPCQPRPSESGPRERSSVLGSWNYINLRGDQQATGVKWQLAPLGWAPAGRPLVGQRELLWEGDEPQFLFPGSGRGSRQVKVRVPRAGARGLEKLQGLYLRAFFFSFFLFLPRRKMTRASSRGECG